MDSMDGADLTVGGLRGVAQNLERFMGTDLAGDHQDAEGLVDHGPGGQCFTQLVVEDGWLAWRRRMVRAVAACPVNASAG